MRLDDITRAEKVEFSGHSFRRLAFLDRPAMILASMPKADEADYTEKLKLKAHNAFLMERDVYLELGYIRDAFSFLRTVITEAYGPNFFAYITRHSQDIELRKKYRIISAEGYPLL